MNQTLKPVKNQNSPSVKLSAEIGTEMQIEIENVGSRIKFTMIGILPKQYLIFRIPDKIDNATTKAALKIGKPINIRSISRGSAFGFTTSIMGITLNPDSLLFVKYPDNIQQHTIRKNQRVKCLLPAKLGKEKVIINGVIADLSRSGCHFQAKKASFNNERIQLTKSNELLHLALSLPGMEGNKSISALIKNTFIDSEKAQIGIQFKDVDEATLKLLDNFIAMSFDLPPF